MQQDNLINHQKISYKWNFFFIPVVLLVLYTFPLKHKNSYTIEFSNLIPVVLIMLAWLLFIFTKLQVELNEYQIRYKLFPFHLKSKTLTKDDLEKVEIVTFSALNDFGGWGIRYNPTTKRTAYILGGDKGLLITKKSGKQILIGTGSLPSEKIQHMLNKLELKD